MDPSKSLHEIYTDSCKQTVAAGRYHTSRDDSCYTIISEAFTSPLCLQVFKSLTTHQRPLPSSWEQRTFSLEILTFLYLYSPQNGDIFLKKFEKDLRLAIPLFPRNSTRHFQHIKPRLSPELCQSFSGELNWADIQAYTSQLAATGGYSKAWLRAAKTGTEFCVFTS